MIYHKDILITPGSLEPDKQGHTSEKLLEALATAALDHVVIEEQDTEDEKH